MTRRSLQRFGPHSAGDQIGQRFWTCRRVDLAVPIDDIPQHHLPLGEPPLARTLMVARQRELGGEGANVFPKRSHREHDGLRTDFVVPVLRDGPVLLDCEKRRARPPEHGPEKGSGSDAEQVRVPVLIARGISRFGERDRQRDVAEKLFDREGSGKVVFVVRVVRVKVVSVAGQVDAEVHDRPCRAEVAQLWPDLADIPLRSSETAEGQALEWFLALREAREEASRDWTHPADDSEWCGGREKVDYMSEQFRLCLEGRDNELLQGVHQLDRLGRSFDRRGVILVVVEHVVVRWAFRREPQIERLQTGDAWEPSQKWVDTRNGPGPHKVDAGEAWPNGSGIPRAEGPLDGRLDPDGGAELLNSSCRLRMLTMMAQRVSSSAIGRLSPARMAALISASSASSSPSGSPSKSLSCRLS